jgi:hypothetical protein
MTRFADIARNYWGAIIIVTLLASSGMRSYFWQLGEDSAVSIVQAVPDATTHELERKAWEEKLSKMKSEERMRYGLLGKTYDALAFAGKWIYNSVVALDEGAMNSSLYTPGAGSDAASTPASTPTPRPKQSPTPSVDDPLNKARKEADAIP